MEIFDPTQWEDKPVPTKKTKASTSSNGQTSDADKVRWCIAELKSKGIDITSVRSDWIKLGFAFVSLGTEGRQLFHELSELYPGYDYSECDKQYDELSKNATGIVTIATFYGMCKDHDVVYQSTPAKETPPVAGKKTEPVFWIIDNEFKPKIQWLGLHNFLKYHGFCTLINLDTKIHARLQNNIVSQVDLVDVKHFVLKRIDRYGEKLPGGSNVKTRLLKDKILAGANSYFCEGNISSLPPVIFKPLRSTKKTAYFPYRNGIVEVSAGKLKITPYSDCKFHIWKSQIIDREFKEIQFQDFNFYKFLENITGNNSERLKSLISCLGYMLHPFRDPSNVQSLVFYDQKISDDAEGGTGKGILSTAMGHIKRSINIDGKNFKFDYSHCWQRVRMDTQLIVFQDTNKWFKFDRLHSVLTDGLSINPKNAPAFFIPYSDSPKIIINTNFILDTPGASNKRRIKEVEFAPHYNETFTPEDEFKELFFHSWDSDSWLKFDNLMMSFMRSYLSEGFVDPGVSDSSKSKRLFLQKYGEIMLEWIENLPKGEKLRKQETVKNFIDEVGKTMEYKMTGNRFAQALKLVASASDIIGKVELGKDKKGNYFILSGVTAVTAGDDLVTTCDDELPF